LGYLCFYIAELFVKYKTPVSDIPFKLFAMQRYNYFYFMQIKKP